MSDKNKILLVITPGCDTMQDAVFHLLVAGTGEHLASHFCSNYSFAKGDLYDNRPERIEELTNRFGEVEVKYIDETHLSQEQLAERNKKWYEELSKRINDEGV